MPMATGDVRSVEAGVINRKQYELRTENGPPLEYRNKWAAIKRMQEIGGIVYDRLNKVIVGMPD